MSKTFKAKMNELSKDIRKNREKFHPLTPERKEQIQKEIDAFMIENEKTLMDAFTFRAYYGETEVYYGRHPPALQWELRNPEISEYLMETYGIFMYVDNESNLCISYPEHSS